MFQDKYGLLPENVRREIENEARETSPLKAGQKYAGKVGMSELGLYQRLKKELGLKKVDGRKGKGGRPGRPIREPLELTEEEDRFLERLGRGEVTLEEASHLVAKKVFHKMLSEPWGVQFHDFFRTELLKIKQAEVRERHDVAMQLIARMFGGQLPPKDCPKCGHPILTAIGETQVVEGELSDEQFTN